VFITIYYLKTSILAFVVIRKVNQLDKQFISSHIVATNQSLHTQILLLHYFVKFKSMAAYNQSIYTGQRMHPDDVG